MPPRLTSSTRCPSDWGVYENLFNVEESTFSFLEDVMTEVMDVFPSEYIHVGGDEAVKPQWENSPRVQARMKELGVKDAHALQGYFIQRMGKFLNQQGRRLIGWDEILEGGLAPNATVMSWRGIDGAIAAAKAGHDTVLSPAPDLYLDHWQSAGDLVARPQQHAVAGDGLPLRARAGGHPRRAAQAHPRPAGQPLDGIHAHRRSASNTWHSRASRRSPKSPGRRPRASTGQDFQRRLEPQLRRYDKLGIAMGARSASSIRGRAAA